jgi:hypothetical protein
VLRRAAREQAEGHVPDGGRRIFDVRQRLGAPTLATAAWSSASSNGESLSAGSRSAAGTMTSGAPARVQN